MNKSDEKDIERFINTITLDKVIYNHIISYIDYKLRLANLTELYSPKDIFNELCCKLLEGKRNLSLKDDTNLLRETSKIIVSIIRNIIKKENRTIRPSEGGDEDENNYFDNISNEEESIEAKFIKEETFDRFVKILEDKNDDISALILYELKTGKSYKEIQDEYGINKNDFQNSLKRIKRCITKSML